MLLVERQLQEAEGADACLLMGAAKTEAELVPLQWKAVRKADDQR